MSDHINIGFVWDRPTLSNMIIMFLHSCNKSVVNSECGQRTIFKLITLQLNNKNRSMVHGLVDYFILFELSWKYSYLQFGRRMVYQRQNVELVIEFQSLLMMDRMAETAANTTTAFWTWFNLHKKSNIDWLIDLNYFRICRDPWIPRFRNK